MKIKFSNIIPAKRYLAMNFFGMLIVRKSSYEKVKKRYKDSFDIYWNKILRHEKIHTAQMKELIYIFFYIWYGLEWLIKLCCYFNAHKAYKHICFEQEANEFRSDCKYLENRKHYYWIRYIFR